MKADLLVHSATQLCTIPPHDGGPQRGRRLGDLGIVEDGAVACVGGRIAAVGPSTEMRTQWQASHEIDASGRVVCPGFVDPHTHAIWAGDRADEFELRIRGATYQEIMARGGGIMSTVRATRSASLSQLIDASHPRLDRMLAHGTTTAEVKTGYGLTTDGELHMLEAIAVFEEEHPITLVPTFLGAHAVPAESVADPDAYVDLVVEEMLPAAWDWARRKIATFSRASDGDSAGPLLFCDVFCDEGAFTLEQSRRVLEAARDLGMGLKIHADEFRSLGGTALAVALDAVSADHLVCTTAQEIQSLGRSNTVAVALPATPFGLAHSDYTPAQDILDAGGILALATDCNPGTAWCESIPFVVALACRYLRITPAQALVAATLNAAHAVGMGQDIGSLQVGRAADIIILDLPHVQHLGYRFGVNPVETVIKKGQVVAA